MRKREPRVEDICVALDKIGRGRMSIDLRKKYEGI